MLLWLIFIGYAMNSENTSTIYCMPTETYAQTKTAQANSSICSTRERVHIIALQEIAW